MDIDPQGPERNCTWNVRKPCHMPIFMMNMSTPYCKEIVTEVSNLSSQSNIIKWSSKFTRERCVWRSQRQQIKLLYSPKAWSTLRASSASLTLKKIFPLVETHFSSKIMMKQISIHSCFTGLQNFEPTTKYEHNYAPLLHES